MGKIIRQSMYFELDAIAQRCKESGEDLRDVFNTDLALATAGVLHDIISSMQCQLDEGDFKAGFPATILLELKVDKWSLTVCATMEWPDDCDVLDGTGFRSDQ